MTTDDLVEKLTEEFKNSSTYLVDVDYENAIADAGRETGWDMPASTSFREYWVKERSKRHLFFYLMTESAHKLKEKQINLQHRFAPYSSLIKIMDDRFKDIMEDRPDEFLDATGLTSDDVVGMFGSKVDAGFSYSLAGEDTTYSDDNVINHSPSDT